ncbi:ABC transporter substrate-binding protein [Desulfitobacterium sp. THU1]|uniref:ABC transporter substrate-binding protein n=1 Tax=Desulfitobacterium sp. THU1 TaxID=3138072 RepID=UPI00311F39B5
MKKNIIATMISVLMVFGLAGCGSQNNAENTGSNQQGAAENKKITFVLDWTPNTNHTGVYVAKELGYFQDAGLEVEIVQPPEGGALSLVAAGKAEFGVSFQEELASALTSDSPLDVVAVGTILQHNTSGIISLKEDNIASPKGMENKVYATWDSPVEKAIIKQVVTKDGGNFDEINMIPSTVTDVISALQTDVDAIWVYYGWDGVATQVKGLETNYFAFKDIDPVLDFYTPVIAASPQYLEGNQETAKAFLAAVAKGYEYAIAQPKEAADILVKYAPELDPELVTASQEYLAEEYKAEIEQWGFIDQSRWDNFYAWMYDNKLIPKKIETGQGFTNAYLPK